MSKSNTGELYAQEIIGGNNLLPITKVSNWISFVSGMIIYPSIQGKRVVFEYINPIDKTTLLTAYIGNSSAFKTKYKGLDMFNKQGYPITTRDGIRSRRLELIPKY